MCELKILMYLLNKISGAERGYFQFFESILGFDLRDIELVPTHHTTTILHHLITFYIILYYSTIFYYIFVTFNYVLCIILSTFYTIDLLYIILYVIIFYHIQLHSIKLYSIPYIPLILLTKIKLIFNFSSSNNSTANKFFHFRLKIHKAKFKICYLIINIPSLFFSNFPSFNHIFNKHCF